MAIEFPQQSLEQSLTTELARFEIGEEHGGWVARDQALDEVVRGEDRDTVIRKIAASCDLLDFGDRPTLCGVPVLVAEVTGDGSAFQWFAFDVNGRRYVSNYIYATRDAALLALNDRYDE